MLGAQRQRLVPVALGQLLLRPVERPVEVAEVAGVGHSVANAALGRGGLNLVIPDRAEQRIGRVRHVAVEAVAASGVWLVKRVLLDLGGVLRPGVALDAGCVAAHVRLELVDRVAVMHRVATHARHRALGVAGAHPHGGELAATGKDCAVVPPAFAVEFRVLLQFNSTFF